MKFFFQRTDFLKCPVDKYKYENLKLQDFIYLNLKTSYYIAIYYIIKLKKRVFTNR